MTFIFGGGIFMKDTKEFYDKTAIKWANTWYEDEAPWKYYIFQKCIPNVESVSYTHLTLPTILLV